MQAVFSGSRGTLTNLARIALAGFMLSVCAVEASAAPILIVCIGADNTAGRGTGRRHPGGVARDQAFPAQLERLLHGRGVDAHVVNAGVPHSTTAGILGRLDADVPNGTRLVILDRAKGNDKQQGGLNTKEYVAEIEARLSARHIPLIRLPGGGRTFGAYRDPDGRHYTAEGHEKVAEYLLPQVLKALGNK